MTKITTSTGFTFEVPALDIDKQLFATRPMLPHTKIERRILAALVNWLGIKGWAPLFVWDGEERVNARDPKAVMEIVGNLDEAVVHFRHVNGNGTHCVFVVGGNGEDFISDYSAGGAFGPLMDEFCDTVVPEVI